GVAHLRLVCCELSIRLCRYVGRGATGGGVRRHHAARPEGVPGERRLSWRGRPPRRQGAMTASSPRQLVFDIVPRPAYGEEDFLVSRANEAALAMIEHWPDWPHWALVIVGPASSGKSHLANVWKLRSN